MFHVKPQDPGVTRRCFTWNIHHLSSGANIASTLFHVEHSHPPGFQPSVVSRETPDLEFGPLVSRAELLWGHKPLGLVSLYEPKYPLVTTCRQSLDTVTSETFGSGCTDRWHAIQRRLLSTGFLCASWGGNRQPSITPVLRVVTAWKQPPVARQTFLASRPSVRGNTRLIPMVESWLNIYRPRATLQLL